MWSFWAAMGMLGMGAVVGLSCARTGPDPLAADPPAQVGSARTTPLPSMNDGGGDPVSRIAFGSCLDPTRPHPILDVIAARKPDVFVMTGDNVYADAMTVGDFERSYGALGHSRSYQALAAGSQILAAWDDHDYGRNDVGKEYELKVASKKAMLDFFGVPAGAARRQRAGNYDAVFLGPAGTRVQILLLDLRWFRDPLLSAGVPGRYRPHAEGPTLLGEAQWKWLELQLREPADLRLLVTGIQLVSVEHPFESWGLFPFERRRLFDVLARTAAQGVVVVAGDRHQGQISCGYDASIGYPLVEITASSLNRPKAGDEENRFRLGPVQPHGEPNFGELDVRWEPSPRVRVALRGVAGELAFAVELSLDQLRSGAGRAAVSACASL